MFKKIKIYLKFMSMFQMETDNLQRFVASIVPFSFLFSISCFFKN